MDYHEFRDRCKRHHIEVVVSYDKRLMAVRKGGLDELWLEVILDKIAKEIDDQVTIKLGFRGEVFQHLNVTRK